MRFSLIVPMYNESTIICDTVRTLSAYLQARVGEYELIFVDDGSTDESADLVRQMAVPHCRVISYTPNHGKGYAVKTGMLEAVGDVVMFLDADLAYGTGVIEQVLAALEQHPERDLLIGSRVLHPEGYAGYTFIRKIASKIFIRILNLVGGFRLSDSQCGCKAFRLAVCRDLFSRVETEGFAFDFEILLWAQKLGYSIYELPVKIINHRESKVHVVRDTFRMLRAVAEMKKRMQ